ncbi:MAG: hypothetical protein HY751_09245 [Nitrospinae bacterium]|nr:hypothetical protein [Nitrospinota bacterium]
MNSMLFQRYSERPARSNRGAVLITALLLLAMITALGLFSATRASMEQRISTNIRDNANIFFAAEGGIHHGLQVLKNLFAADTTNKVNIAMGQPPVWSFLLNGATLPAASNYYCQGCDTGAGTVTSGAWLTSGTQVVSRTFTQGNLDISYTVTAWNNDESSNTTAPCTGVTSATTDCDSIIYVRSEAYAYVAGTTDALAYAVQEVTVNGNAGNSIGLISGLSQEFANEGKTSTAVDVNEIDAGSLAGGATI